jgi:allantoinase
MTHVLRSTRVVTPEGLRPATVHVEGARITRVGGYEDRRGGPLRDVGDLVVMPGVIDTHVHVNDPGRTEWEGFETATRAALKGGITTLLDMPLNSIPATTTVDALETKRVAAAKAKTHVNIEYIGGVVPGNADQLEPLVRAGVRAFKCFLSPSGVDEFPNVSEHDLGVALPILAKLDVPLMVHAEDPALLLDGGPSPRYDDYLASRPASAERSAIEMLVRLVERTRAPVHIVHLSSPASLDVVRTARARGLPITVETCPHYLTFAAEEIPDGATEFKCAPPIRGRAEREGLWRALADGDIDLIASDHSPCPPTMKNTHGDFFSAWGGIASLQLSLSAVWTGARARGFGIDHVVRWMCENTAALARLGARKGKLAEGYDADIVVFDPDASFVVDASELVHRHKLTPYNGRTLYGVVRGTYVAELPIPTH